MVKTWVCVCIQVWVELCACCFNFTLLDYSFVQFEDDRHVNDLSVMLWPCLDVTMGLIISHLSITTRHFDVILSPRPVLCNLLRFNVVGEWFQGMQLPPFWKGSSLKWKNLLPMGASSFLKSRPFYEGLSHKQEVTRHLLCKKWQKVYPVHPILLKELFIYLLLSTVWERQGKSVWVNHDRTWWSTTGGCTWHGRRRNVYPVPVWIMDKICIMVCSIPRVGSFKNFRIYNTTGYHMCDGTLITRAPENIHTQTE